MLFWEKGKEWIIPEMDMYKTRNTGSGNGMRGTRGMRGMLYSGECTQTFQGISSNIPGNIVKHFGECSQTFRGMLLNIPGNVLKYSPEYRQTFRGMLPNIPGMSPNILGNVVEHSGECPIYFDGRELVEVSSITFAFSVVLLIVCSVIFCVKDFAKLLAARLNSGENLISRSWKSSEKFLLVSATQDSVSNHRTAIIFFFLMGVPKQPWFF